jgi:hypothetical protein
MLMWLWWGLLGFLAVVLSVWLFVTSLGPIGRFVVVIIAGVAVGHLVDRRLTADQRCADDFLSAWAAESADWPEGRMYTRSWGEFVDYERLSNPNPYLAQHWRLRWHSRARLAGSEDVEDVEVVGTGKPVQAKAFVADARLHGSEHDVDFRAKIRVWVARDTHRVAKFQFKGIAFE